MINPLALKVGLGGTAATTLGTVGFIYKDKIKDFFTTQHSAYLIIKASTAPDSALSKNLYESDGKTKNFKCIVTTNNNLEDLNCEIFSINSRSDGKLNNLSEIQKSSTKATKSEIKVNAFFKLTIAYSSLKTNWDGQQKIDLVSLNEKVNEASQKYGSFTLEHKVAGGTVSGKTNLIVVKMTNKLLESDLSKSDQFKCTIVGGPADKEGDCGLFKIDDPSKNIKDILTANIKDPGKDVSYFVKNKLFIIDLKRSDKKDVTFYNGKNISIIAESKKVGEFAFVTALAESSTAAFSKNTSTLILS